MADFETACQKFDIKLFILPPRSPKLNGHVGRAQRTHAEEFYELYEGELEVSTLNQALLKWERIIRHLPTSSLPRRTHPFAVSSPVPPKLRPF